MPSAKFSARIVSLTPKCNAVVMAEIKFRQITVEVLFSTMLVGAAHPAFED